MAKIENPFGFDKNDLNLGYFCQEIIAKEVEAVTSRDYSNPSEWIFSSTNHPFGQSMPAADRMANSSPAELRTLLAQSRKPSVASSSDTKIGKEGV